MVLASVQHQQEPPIWGAVKKETLLSVNRSIGYGVAVRQLNSVANHLGSSRAVTGL